MPDPEGRSSTAQPPAGAAPPKREPASLFERWLLGAAGETGPAPDTDLPDTRDLIDHAEAFAGLRVVEVMTPRADISALEVSAPLLEVVRAFATVERSRMPVYQESLDEPLGVVHIRDLLKLIAPPPGAPTEGYTPPWNEPVLRRLRRELLYVPGSMRAADLLLKMRTARMHMALVIDEFGGVDGLVTLEDLLESLVGEIDDEHDWRTEPAVVEHADGVLECQARTPLEVLERRLGVTLTPEGEEELETVGGLVGLLAGRVPQAGESIGHPDGHVFDVLEADARRMHRLRIRPRFTEISAEAASEVLGGARSVSTPSRDPAA